MTLMPTTFDLEQGLIELPGAPPRSIWAFTCPTPECTVPVTVEAIEERYDNRIVAMCKRGACSGAS